MHLSEIKLISKSLLKISNLGHSEALNIYIYSIFCQNKKGDRYYDKES